jgi:hypothetical protein
MEKLNLYNFELKHECRELFKFKRPDFVFLTKDNPVQLLYASFVVELQMNKINSEHKGKIIKYNTEVLEANPRRKDITSVLTNLDVMHLVKTYRNKDKEGKEEIRHLVSNPIMFWTDGLLYIQQMIETPDQVGFHQKDIFTIDIKRNNE